MRLSIFEHNGLKLLQTDRVGFGRLVVCKGVGMSLDSLSFS